MITEEIRAELFRLQDTKYRDFQSKLIPTVDPETVIGVRTPELRSYAKALLKREKEEKKLLEQQEEHQKTESGQQIAIRNAEAEHQADRKEVEAEPLEGACDAVLSESCLTVFLNDLPHKYFDENQLHAFIISGMKDYERSMEEVCGFLPYVDNWATCDQMSPKIFKKHRPELLEKIREWLAPASESGADKTYTIRFAIGMLMEHFLDEDFDREYLEMVAAIRSDEYYINMMIAWYFATALVKQYEAVLPFIEEKRLDDWTHNKAIQKSIESRRITPEQKTYLRSLKVKK